MENTCLIQPIPLITNNFFNLSWVLSEKYVNGKLNVKVR